MNANQYQYLEAEIQRHRPLGGVVLSILVTLPSLWETITGSVTVPDFLARFALAMAASLVLVWAVSAVVLHFARVQARSGSSGRRPDLEP